MSTMYQAYSKYLKNDNLALIEFRLACVHMCRRMMAADNKK